MHLPFSNLLSDMLLDLALLHDTAADCTWPADMLRRTSLLDLVDGGMRQPCALCRCYLDLAARTPDYDTQVMLGEALLAVQEPGQAVRAFEAALELNPRDSGLACRIGKALVATHDYQRAVDYFNKAIRNSPGGWLGWGRAAH